MLDIVVAGSIARHFRTRAEERGKSGTKVARTVLLVILGAEAAGIVSFGLPNGWEVAWMVGGAVLGFLAGVIAAYLIGDSMTDGPVIPGVRESMEVIGRECHECQRTIREINEGRQCKRCRHAIHRRCRKEHRLAHERFDAEAKRTKPADASHPS